MPQAVRDRSRPKPEGRPARDSVRVEPDAIRGTLPETMTRRAVISAGSFNADAMTVEAVISTFSDVARRDNRGPYVERLDPAGLDMGRIVGAPVLDGHRQGSARDVIGIVENARSEDGKLVATIRLSGADDAAPIISRIREGTLRGVSVGYRVSRWSESIDPTTKSRVRTAAAWSIFEVSAVPVPADPGATFRSNDMPEDDVIETMPDDQANQIRSLAQVAGLTRGWAEDAIDANMTLDDARTAARDAIMQRSREIPRIRVQSPASEEPAVRLRAMEDALHIRVAGGNPSDAARPYMAHTLRDFARDLLSMRGVSTAGMDPDQLFRAAMHTTSDFPNLLQGVGRRTLLASYTAAASPLKTLARQGTRSDFRSGSTLRLGELGALQKVSEAGEIKHVSRGESAESYALDTYGALFSISRKALINDDLGAFNDWASAAGQASAQTEAALLWGLLSGNNGAGPMMGDGKRLFHADHGNLMTGAPLSEESLSDARLALRQQKGSDGKTVITVTPKYLVVGPELETQAEKLLTAINATTTDNVNPFAGKLTLAVEPRIADDAWFVFADPATVPVLEYSYLSSAPGPQMSSREGWEVLSVEYRVVLDFGAGAIDWRGAVRNPGV